MQKQLTVLSVSALFLILSGCSKSYEPLVDMQGVDPATYQTDLSSCRQLSEKIGMTDGVATDSAIGGGSGAVVGAATGIFTHRSVLGAAVGATSGVLGGVGTNVRSNLKRKDSAVASCMSQRGYHVID